METTNRVLRALSEGEWQRLEPYLKPVTLRFGEILYEPGDTIGHAIFPLDGVISLQAPTADGVASQVAMVGNDGVIGLPIFPPVNVAPYRILVQIPSKAYRVRAEVLRSELRLGGSLERAAMEHLHHVLSQMAQSGACNRHHNTRQRLCRWLLMMRDRVPSDTIALTQEFIGQVLGADRKRISAAAAQLQDAGYIRQRHGEIRILNRRGIEGLACECYAMLRRMLGKTEADPRSQRPDSLQPTRV